MVQNCVWAWTLRKLHCVTRRVQRLRCCDVFHPLRDTAATERRLAMTPSLQPARCPHALLVVEQVNSVLPIKVCCIQVCANPEQQTLHLLGKPNEDQLPRNIRCDKQKLQLELYQLSH